MEMDADTVFDRRALREFLAEELDVDANALEDDAPLVFGARDVLLEHFDSVERILAFVAARAETSRG